jgi:Holliday junction DNA helicase RuvA
MFNSLRGTVTRKLGSTLHLETGGVEWEITIPATDLIDTANVGDEGRVWTYLVHREDAMLLFGFASEKRRETFLELLKVEGIGPKAAVKIMGGISEEELVRALENDDLARLERVPGLGKKTAQKILLAMKGKIVLSGGDSQGGINPPLGDVEKALVEMGFERRTVSAAVERAFASYSGAEKDRESEVFKTALLSLSGGR